MAELGTKVRALKGSDSDEGDRDQLYAAVKPERGSLDIVFANAGGGSPLAFCKIIMTASEVAVDGGLAQL